MSDAVRESLSGVIKSRLARETLLDRPPRRRTGFDALDRILGGGLSPGLIISNCDITPACKDRNCNNCTVLWYSNIFI